MWVLPLIVVILSSIMILSDIIGITKKKKSFVKINVLNLIIFMTALSDVLF